MNVTIAEDWKKALQPEFDKPYFEALTELIKNEKKAGKIIYPKGSEIFNAFNTTPIDEVKVVILGQDPYHGPGQAHGLSFSVPQGTPLPPSLQNIFKELHADLGLPTATYQGNLLPWAKQGVLLLNAALTVRVNDAASHASIGWQNFTDAVINYLSTHKKNIVFILWGNFAQQKQHLIDESKHLVIKSAHPSPLSASRGFFGSKPFSKANHYLQLNQKMPIDWHLN